ncbi:hypothetical protein EJV46_09520 [Roseococcus sp. SYP-B2431]|uniref:hypothetical protein n=1 Tax=Roseococcus sp. SYP-B2431 TaxID=2496640 RepID=UPI00103DF8D0|nr:hypothetical protein [Roseococcus sp. SYP-B2431]TCH98795.1 hypothetical protein EJV46_09520 [Roseococcus sp. SYP-B2431]
MRSTGLPLLAFLAAGLPGAGPAVAQQRVVVVPAGAEVAVPARGASGPRLVNAPRPRIPSRNAGGPSQPGARPMLESGSALGGSGLAVPALIALPIAAIAAAAVAIPGGGNGSTSAPARTR